MSSCPKSAERLLENRDFFSEILRETFFLSKISDGNFPLLNEQNNNTTGTALPIAQIIFSGQFRSAAGVRV